MKNWLIRLLRAYEAGRLASARERARIYGYPGPTRPQAAVSPTNDRVANDTAVSRKRDAA